ncbi:hypothetical protein PHLGIDRAFT_47251, partial [Phlebiopsis gigantea 11061_1 CR5-6]
KTEGTIEDIFSSFHIAPPFDPRFAELKKDIWKEDMVESWRQVLNDLENVTSSVIEQGSQSVPQVPYLSLKDGLAEYKSKVKSAGCAIIRGAVPEEDALEWDRDTRAYIAANTDKVRGSPANSTVFYELYQSPAQIRARSHPNIVESHRRLLTSLFHASDSTEVSLHTPISYFDRLRIRPPGPSQFTLGPHMDGGGIERWEDPQYRSVYAQIFNGGNAWRGYDPWDLTERLGARQDLYDAPSQCSILRPLQGWLSLSHTGPREGTLKVLPFINEATAYIMLRPFFKPTAAAGRAAGEKVPLDFGNWEPALGWPDFPGAVPGKAQVLTSTTHPHLRLDEGALVSIPEVHPGDQVFWHMDLVHAVEAEHSGARDSVVFYIPAAAYTVENAGYLRSQLKTFAAGLSSPDFPGGPGEAGFVGRVTPEDVVGAEARKVFGLEEWTV